MSSLLAKLADWHSRHCDGEREHWYGITIQTTDNPGWWVKIDLTGTPLAGQSFGRVAEAVDEFGRPAADRWLHCQMSTSAWHGAGDDTRLEEILSRFLAWADKAERQS